LPKFSVIYGSIALSTLLSKGVVEAKSKKILGSYLHSTQQITFAKATYFEVVYFYYPITSHYGIPNYTNIVYGSLSASCAYRSGMDVAMEVRMKRLLMGKDAQSLEDSFLTIRKNSRS
jgi:hypothetical protein